MSQDTNSNPYRNDGETVYGTTSTDSETTTERDWPEHTDPEWLHFAYHIQKKSQSEMGEVAGVSQKTISRWMNKHDIETRDCSEAVAISRGRDPVMWDDNWLREQYCEKSLSLTEIAERRGTRPQTVSDALDRFGIETRNVSEALKKSHANRREGSILEDKSKLQYLYHECGLSQAEIAERCDFGKGAIQSAFKRHGIETRSNRAANLLKYKTEKCEPSQTDRELISSDGIDASWRDITDLDDGCYIPYRDPSWLKNKVAEGLTDAEIADICDVEVAHSTIYRWRERFGIGRSGPDNGAGDDDG